jgi:hypothetical protein
MATEEGESSSKVVIPKTTEAIEKAKDKDRDIVLELQVTWDVKCQRA